MGSDIGRIQSLKAIDAWIDVINANINGGVRTAFKQSRLHFAGSNTQIDRPATASTLPLQFPEPSLVTANTVIGPYPRSDHEQHGDVPPGDSRRRLLRLDPPGRDR